jgi:leader peptidase (prepilin peptidase)/N-methyltransferase
MILTLGILMDAFFIALLAWCGNSDLKKRIISNMTIAILLCLGVAHIAFVVLNGSTWWMYPTGLLLAIPFFIAWLKNSMGAGDVKLIIAISLYLGLFKTLIAFALMVPVCAVLIVYSSCKHKTLKYRIPLAPVIGIGAAGAVVFGYLYGMMCF